MKKECILDFFKCIGFAFLTILIVILVIMSFGLIAVFLDYERFDDEAKDDWELMAGWQ